ncbi:hypothetical protein BDQ17DRAFT_1343156 [Cyathus striatus]|nr:hypothetical protein BDQ17DRAFT_1343156 [Cyathus striatus]
MGRSAKLHKRVPKKTAVGNSIAGTSSSQMQAQAAKKKATLKDKSSGKQKRADGETVLGGVDYVSLLLGGRRRAKEEAQKLPPNDS